MGGVFSKLVSVVTRLKARERATEALAQMHAATAAAPTRAVFIDSSVPDLDDLVAGAKPGEHVFVVAPGKDGLAQIVADLEATHLTHLSSIAIVAHGASGTLKLGSSSLNDGDLGAHVVALARIGAALGQRGKLELYACDVAAGAAGKTFIADLSHDAEGVDVAAATQAIGKTATGESWTLDAATGANVAAPSSPFTAAAMNSYQGTLAAQPTGQLLFFNTKQLANGNTTFEIDASNSNSASTTTQQITTLTPDANSNIPQVPVVNYSLDTANNLYFYVDPSGDLADSNISTGAAVSSIKFANFNNPDGGFDSFGAVQVDPTAHVVYASLEGGDFTNPKVDTRPTNEILSISYNGKSGQIGTSPYNPTTQTQTSNSQTLISNTSDANFHGAAAFALDQGAQRLYYATFNTTGYKDAEGNSFSASNEIDSISATAFNQKTATTIAALPLQFLADGTTVNPNFTGQIVSVAVDAPDGRVYFNTAPIFINNAYRGNFGLYEVATSGGTVTKINTSGTNINVSQAAQSIVYDPNAHQIYVASLPSTGETPPTTKDSGEIYQFTLDAQTGTKITGTNVLYKFSSTQSSSDTGFAYDSLPVLTATGTATHAIQNGAAVTLLTNAAATDADSGGSTASPSGGFIRSASVQVLKGTTAEPGDVLLVNGQTFGSTATSFTDATTGATFNIAYSTTNDTLSITSPIGANGVTDTDAQYAHLLGLVQYKDGFTDTSTGVQPTRTLTYQVNDGAFGNPAGTNATQTTVTIDRPPTIVAGGYKVPADVLAGASATANAPGALTGDVDPNGGTLTINGVATNGGTMGTVGQPLAGTYGSLTLNADGSYSYTAGSGASAPTGSHPMDGYSFSVQNAGGTASETFTATLDRAPTGTGITVTAPEAQTTTGAAKAAFANDTDADGDPLTVASVSYTNPATNMTTTGTVGQAITGQFGTLTLNADGSYSYNANNTVAYTAATAAGQPTVDDFTYTAADGLGGTTAPETLEADVVCFAAGTRIRTARGEVPVEALRVGDLAVTSSGARRPIRWLGHRVMACHAHPRPHEAHPIRIAAHAFAPNRPARDLHVSPGHSICVDILGEVLITAGALVNGTTIVQVEVDTVDYWHVALDSHDILVAENLACESYIDMGNRSFFVESGVVALDGSPDAVRSDAIHADKTAYTHADFCRPFHLDGRLVEAAVERLRRRAIALGRTPRETALDRPHANVDALVDAEIAA